MIATTLPIIIFILLLMIEGFISGWQTDMRAYDDLPSGGQYIDGK